MIVNNPKSRHHVYKSHTGPQSKRATYKFLPRVYYFHFLVTNIYMSRVIKSFVRHPEFIKNVLTWFYTLFNDAVTNAIYTSQDDRVTANDRKQNEEVVAQLTL
jgi:hypothetical protein